MGIWHERKDGLKSNDKNTLVGITGGIGSGKSIVSNLLRKRGFFVLVADEIAKEALDSVSIEVLKANFGESILDSSGKLSRRQLRRQISTNKEQRDFLEKITHPIIRESADTSILRAHSEGNSTVFYEVPLLFEKKLEGRFNKIWLIVAPEEVRIRRICARDNCTVQEALAMIRMQLPDEVKSPQADVVIENATDSVDDIARNLDGLLISSGYGPKGTA